MPGQLWQKLKAPYEAEGKFVLPLNIEFDDYEPDNALGSHSGEHSLGALYADIPCLPPTIQSSLDNMFLLSLFESKYRKRYGNAITFAPAIEELTFLQERGIVILNNDKLITVYFCLTLVIADNLGHSNIEGFVEGFTGNYYCRICKLHRKEMYHYCKPVPINRMRTVGNYADDVAVDNVSETGIWEECEWNKVPSYHCIENPSCDTMHDVSGGALKCDIFNILYYLIEIRGYFSLETLCERIDGFDYGVGEACNKPPTSHITLERLRNCSLNLSASEMLCLARYLGQMVGDLVPAGNRVWKLYQIVREIVEILTCPFVEEGIDVYLSVLVQEHHEHEYFGALKPKHHFLLHYAYLMI